MADLNPGIILQGQPVNALGAMADGLSLANAHNQMNRQGQMQNFLRDNGAAVMSGDVNALGQLAQYDPQAALDIQGSRQQMDIRARAQENDDQRLAIARQTAARQAAEAARNIQTQEEAALAAREAEQAENLSMSGMLAVNQGQGAAWLAQYGQAAAELLEIDPSQITEQNLPLILNGLQGGAEGMREGLGGNGANVQRGEPLADGSGFVTLMSDGTAMVTTAGGERLTGQAAQEFVANAQNNYTESQRSIYGARREGTLEANIEMGGAAAAAEDAGKQAIDMSGEAWSSYSRIQTSLSNIDEALAALDRGAETGIVMQYLPNVTEASASLQNAMDSMGLDVVGAVTFGALSEGELRLAMNVAVPRGLGPQELRTWLQRKRDAQEKTAAMLADAAQFLGQPDTTLADWIARNRGEGGRTEIKPLSPTEIQNMTDEELLDYYRIGAD